MSDKVTKISKLMRKKADRMESNASKNHITEVEKQVIQRLRNSAKYADTES